MEYKTYPCEVKFKYLVRRGLPVVAGFFSEKDALDYALSIGGAVIKANGNARGCLLYTSDAAEDAHSGVVGVRRRVAKKQNIGPERGDRCA